MFQELFNPKTNDYLKLKQFINSSQFPWFWNDRSVKPQGPRTLEVPYLSHCVLASPGQHPDIYGDKYFSYPKENSPHIGLFHFVLVEILNVNNIDLNCFFRINVNLTFPIAETKNIYPHVDHIFPHKNLLIYLNEADGDTILCDENDKELHKSSPKEDKIVIFEGKHYHFLPTNNTRKVIVCTYM
jgi:hypothetical protein